MSTADNNNLKQIKCPVCGGILNYNINERIYNCECCGAKFQKNDFQNDDFFIKLHSIDIKRQSGDFDTALAMYSDMIKEYSSFSGIDLKPLYWGKFLCEERIVFRHVAGGIPLPNFHEIVTTSFENYNKVIELCSTDLDKQIYTNQLNRILNTKQSYNNLFKTEKPFDIFISFKSVAYDTQLGFDIYNRFAKDYNIFFSPKSINEITPDTSEYSSRILFALNTSKVIILICSDTEHLIGEGWVRDEWMSAKRQKKIVIPILVNGFEYARLPKELRADQYFTDNKDLTYNLNTTLKKIFSTKNDQEKFDELLISYTKSTEYPIRLIDNLSELKKDKKFEEIGAHNKIENTLTDLRSKIDIFTDKKKYLAKEAVFNYIGLDDITDYNIAKTKIDIILKENFDKILNSQRSNGEKLKKTVKLLLLWCRFL